MMETKSAEWHEERRQGIGGSDAGKIMAGGTAWVELWEEKTGRREPEDLSGVLQVQLGIWTEEFNRRWFEARTGHLVNLHHCEHLVHKEHSFMRCNLDGRVGDDVFEAKHVSAFSKPEDIVERYQAQLHHNMIVAGCEHAFLSVIYGNHLWEMYEIPLDTSYAAELVSRERDFWWYVTHDQRPEEDVEAVKSNFSLDDMREVDMSGNNSWAIWSKHWLENRAPAKLFKDSEKEIKGLIEPDVKLAFGRGIAVKRAKNGSLRISERSD